MQLWHFISKFVAHTLHPLTIRGTLFTLTVCHRQHCAYSLAQSLLLGDGLINAIKAKFSAIKKAKNEIKKLTKQYTWLNPIFRFTKSQAHRALAGYPHMTCWTDSACSFWPGVWWLCVNFSVFPVMWLYIAINFLTVLPQTCAAAFSLIRTHQLIYNYVTYIHMCHI